MRSDVRSHDPRTVACEICGEVRERLNYRLCCRLPANHWGEHRLTPEILPTDRRTVPCPCCDTALQVVRPPATVERLDDGTGTHHSVIRDRDRQILHECST
jgi:hypothetical protein